MYKRDFSSIDEEALLSDFSAINWLAILPSSTSASVNEVFQSFFDHVNSIIDKHVPLRKLTKKEVKSLSKPWITAGLKKSIKVKHNLYKKFLVSRDPYYHTKYKYYRKEYAIFFALLKRIIIKIILILTEEI